MANDYNDENSNIYGDWKPRGWLAGWQYQDKLNDYKTARNLNNEGKAASNMEQILQNRDFQQAETSRRMSYDRDYLRNKLEFEQIGEEGEVFKKTTNDRVSHRIKMEIERQKGEQAGIYLNKMATISSMLTSPEIAGIGSPEEKRDALIQMLDPSIYSEEITKLQSANGQQLDMGLKMFSSLNPEILKSNLDRRNQGDVIDSNERMNSRDNTTKIYIAQLEADIEKMTAGKNPNRWTWASNKEPEWRQAKRQLYFNQFRKDQQRPPNREEKAMIEHQITVEWADLVSKGDYGYQQGVRTQSELDLIGDLPSAARQEQEPRTSQFVDSNESIKKVPNPKALDAYAAEQAGEGAHVPNGSIFLNPKIGDTQKRGYWIRVLVPQESGESRAKWIQIDDPGRFLDEEY